MTETLQDTRPARRQAVTAIAALLLTGCAASAADAPCDALADLKLDKARVVSADSKSGGKEFFFKGMFIGVPFFDVPPSCRVTLELTPSDDSSIRTEVWLPSEGWTGKLQGIGNGGFGGAVDKLSLLVALQHGYVGAATDIGHEANDRDGTWALHHPEKIRDYGYRAIHETAVNAKKLITAYYGRGPEKSYFGSCSNGGRQGLLEAQRYPEDYDGIVAGAPALAPTQGLPNWAWIQQQMLRPGAYISADKVPAIAAATIKACDALDGLADGLIDNPPACHFNPDVLLCAGKETDQCLTAPQVESLRAIYTGAGEGYPGFEPGAEDGKAAWTEWLFGDGPRSSIQYGYAQDFFRYLAFDDPKWMLDSFEFKRDQAAFEKKLHEILDAASPDLSAFAARGGKLIMYHGWSDPALPPRTTIEYYQKLRAHMGADKADEFTRLYMAPGLLHCIAGPGPNVFGQLPPGGKLDPGHHVAAAVEAWVEKGQAPGPIVATRYDSNFKALVAPERARKLSSRPLCPWPQVAKWDGKGNRDDAASFSCVAETRN